MSKHATLSEMDAFCAGTLPGEKALLLGEHIEDCLSCGDLFKKVSADDKYFSPLTLNLSPPSRSEDYHLDFGKLVSYVDDQLDEEERGLVDDHCQTCARCGEDLRFFKEYRMLEDSDPRGRHHRPGLIASYVKEVIGSFTSGVRRPSPTIVYTASLSGLCVTVVLISIIFFQTRDTTREGPLSVQLTNNLPSDPPDSSSPAAPTVQSAGEQPKEEPAEIDETIVKKRIPLVVALNDRGRKYGLDRESNLVGLAGYPAVVRREIQSSLQTGHVGGHVSAVLGSVSTINNKRGAAGGQEIRLHKPSGTIVASERPTLVWSHLSDDMSYVVTVVDSKFNLVTQSPELKTNQWRLDKPLCQNRPNKNSCPDEVFRWQVRAIKDGKEVPSVSQSVAIFKLIAPEKALEIERAKKSSPPHIVLGLLYAKEGLLDDAEREFQLLLKNNPTSKIAQKLLRSVRSHRAG